MPDRSLPPRGKSGRFIKKPSAPDSSEPPLSSRASPSLTTMSSNLPEPLPSGTAGPSGTSQPTVVSDPVPVTTAQPNIVPIPLAQSISPQAAGNVLALLQSLFAITGGTPLVAAPVAQEPVVASRATPLPPFVANPSPFIGKSLHTQFPEIEAGTLLEIVRHDFKPNDLFKLALRARDKADPDRPESLKKFSGPYAAYPSLHSLLTPLTTYFSILQSFAASSGDATAASLVGIGGQRYIAHILDLHQRYEWLAVVEYHIHFHLRRRCEMAEGDYNGWLRADPDLLNSYVYDRRRIVRSEVSRASSKKDVKDQVCFAFNKGDCSASTCPSGRLHKCRKCGSTQHGEKACKKD